MTPSPEFAPNRNAVRRIAGTITLVALAAIIIGIKVDSESIVRGGTAAAITCTAVLMIVALRSRRFVTAIFALAGIAGFTLLVVNTELSSIPLAYLSLGFGGSILAAAISFFRRDQPPTTEK